MRYGMKNISKIGEGDKFYMLYNSSQVTWSLTDVNAAIFAARLFCSLIQ